MIPAAGRTRSAREWVVKLALTMVLVQVLVMVRVLVWVRVVR